jgi:Uma2 family endonuclease
MAEPAIRRMTVMEFLRWEDGTDRRYELLDGVPVATAPPAAAHRILSVRLGGLLDAALRKRRPCNAQSEAGIQKPGRNDTYYIADLAATCRPHERGQQAIEDPVLIVEILSPGTERYDRQVKVPDYRHIPSVQEIVLIDSESIYAEVLRRDGDRWTADPVLQDGMLSLSSVGADIAMADLYEGIDVDAEPRPAPPPASMQQQ